MSAGSEPISDDEVVYRRVPASPNPGWYDPSQSDKPSPYAFRANQHDSDGRSLARKKYASAEEACAKGREGKDYFVVELRAGDLAERGLTLKPAPLDEDPGHCILTDIRAENARIDEVHQLRLLLAEELTRDVLGPFPGKKPVG